MSENPEHRRSIVFDRLHQLALNNKARGKLISADEWNLVLTQSDTMDAFLVLAHLIYAPDSFFSQSMSPKMRTKRQEWLNTVHQLMVNLADTPGGNAPSEGDRAHAEVEVYQLYQSWLLR